MRATYHLGFDCKPKGWGLDCSITIAELPRFVNTYIMQLLDLSYRHLLKGEGQVLGSSSHVHAIGGYPHS